MNNRKKYSRLFSCHILFLIWSAGCFAQDSLSFKGQFSAWEHFNADNNLPLWTGARYIPQINYRLFFADDRLLDFEASANAYGTVGLNPFDTASFDGQIKPYRFWARYSARQFEIRAGLQKINFGSATLLRPLMWFDQVDPRDPLKLTDGVWGVLGRYYFLNNANIWAWALYGNDQPKGWELIGSNKNIPEFGGRLQLPVGRGEAAFSYHHRVAKIDSFVVQETDYDRIPENRIGFDTKLDLIIGVWVEAVWVKKKKDLGALTNQEILNIGADYTFGVGNGLTVIFEQLFASYNKTAFSFENTISFSMFNLTYPVGLFDNLSAIVYYDWTNNALYNYVNWQKQFNKITLYLMGYVNSKKYNIPTQGKGENLYAGTGIQVMLVFNH